MEIVEFNPIDTVALEATAEGVYLVSSRGKKVFLKGATGITPEEE